MKKTIALLIAALLLFSLLGGCAGNAAKNVKLDPQDPVTITIWHYYNGAIMNAFESLIKEFNETVGMTEGIIVEHYGMGNISELEKSVIASANKEVGSLDMPNIFASYADTAYTAEKMEILANLDDYFTKDEQKEYLDSYIAEGRIGLKGELRIFPIAKATETFMINETDWLPFAEANGITYDDLSSMEDLVRVAEIYYQWSGGKSFFGRDSMANLFIIAYKQFDKEIFKVENGTVAFDIDEDIMRKIWDSYYVPYINGCFYSYGRYRSDDAKVGDILAYVGSSSSAAYFPAEVTADGDVHPIKAAVLPVPCFEGAKQVMVQQGAGMVVTKSTQQEEYASVRFLKWFTDAQQNIAFSALSSYMPVKKEAVDHDAFMSELSESGYSIHDLTKETLSMALREVEKSELYTNKAFTGGSSARAVLENSLQNKAVADREAVLKLIEGGSTREQAAATFNTDESFKVWLNELTHALNDSVK